MDNDNTIAEKLNPPLPPDAKQLMDKIKKGKILRYQIDIFSVIAVITAVLVQFLAYWYRWPWYSLALVIMLMRTSHLAEHNHAHLPIFHNRFLNESIGWLMFLNCGIPLQSYREQHVHVHHQHLGTAGDWTSPWTYQGTIFPTKPVNKIYYLMTFMVASMLECAFIYIKKPLSKSTRYFTISMIIVGIIMIALAMHDFFNFTLYYAIPWIITYIYLALASWKQHVGCEYTSVYTTAINDFNIDSRELGFNIGYHTAHHWYPHLHWSLLEKFHDTYLAPHVPSNYYTPIWFPLWSKK